MKLIEMAEIIRKGTGCSQHLAFNVATDIKIAEAKEKLDERKQARLKC
ncbi:hypothetical protein [Paenibacillus planticolens]|nr:hypothetical protein [Paenibacillus planticolens]